MRFNSSEALFVVAALAFALLLFIEGISAAPSDASMVSGANDVVRANWAAYQRAEAFVEASKESRSSHDVSEASTATSESNDACMLETEAMRARDPTWRMESEDFETERLPRCMHEWSVETLPPGAKQYPVLECRAPLPWTSGCYAAGGMVATVTVKAIFLEPANTSAQRTLTFPSCFSNNKACTASRNAADALWVQRLNQINAWCTNQTNPYTQCADVNLETNFWQVANLPKIIRIVIAVLVSLAVVVLIIVIVVYCRWKHKRQHDEALERTLLLRMARKSALLQSQATDSDMPITLDASSSIPSSPNTIALINSHQVQESDISTPLLLSHSKSTS